MRPHVERAARRMGAAGLMLSTLVIACLAQAALAQPGGPDVERYPSAREAQAHPPPVPAYCLGSTGQNTCVATILTEEGSQGQRWWRPGQWVGRGAAVCVDSQAPDRDLDCAAPGAVAAGWLIRPVELPPPPARAGNAVKTPASR